MLTAFLLAAAFAAFGELPLLARNLSFSATALLTTDGTEGEGSNETPPDKPEGDTGETPPDKPEDEGGGGGGGGGETPPDKPSGGGGEGGGETPPDKPEGGGEGGGEGGEGGGGGTEASVTLKGAWQLDSGTDTLDGGDEGATLVSTNADENVILVQSNACLTVSNYTLNKSGDCSSEDNSNFYAVNAVVASKTGGTNCLDKCVINSNAEGANCLFASGSGSTIYAYNCTLASTEDSSRGLDATYEGTVIASKMSINTKGAHCASLATDRGNGYISVTESTLATAGDGSALIYSTGVIEANGVTGTATGAQIAGIEGLSTIRIKNSCLSGSAKKASEPVANGVIIYQSNSGDSTEGTATFEVSDSTLKSAISGGAMFYVTNTKADIRIQNAVLDFDSGANCLVNAAGNDGDNGWGTAGSNGAEVVLTAIDQTLAGTLAVDGISSLDLYLTNSTYTGTVEKDSTNAGDGDVNVSLSADSTWIVTASCTLQGLTVASGAAIVDADGKAVSIVSTSGTSHVSGTSDLKITVSAYATENVAVTRAITAFEIDRSAFEKMYEKAQGRTGGTYYVKPHAPSNAVIKVKVKGVDEPLTPDMDHKYWLDDYWDEEAGVTLNLIYATESDYFFIDGSSTITQELTVTTNKMEIDPPACTATVRAQAKSGKTYYRTLRQAIDEASGRAKISLHDSVTLEETLVVTNAIVLDLAANTLTLGGTLTNAFHFTGKATVSNGTIRCALSANAEGRVLLRFTDCTATLSALTLSGDGCLLYVDGASVTLTNDCALTCDSAASVCCTAGGSVTIAEGTRKDDAVVIAAPEGCLWENGVLVAGAAPEAVAPGVESDAYDDALAATNAAAQINANKANCIVVPTGVEGTAKMTYLTKVTATATADNHIVIGLTPEAEVAEQALVDEAVASEGTAAALTSADDAATATISTTTPGLYYWIEGGTDVSAVSEAGAGVLSTDGGSVELTKPTLDATKGRAFFRISAGLSAPTPR